MDMFQSALFGVVAALLAVQLRSLQEEYRLFVILAAGILFAGLVLDKIAGFVEGIREIQRYVAIDTVYMDCILKMLGITCIAEFSAGICRDSGHDALAEQISLLARLSILSFSMPVVLAILESIRNFL